MWFEFSDQINTKLIINFSAIFKHNFTYKMSKEILEGIKDTDCRLKKVFDDMMEQGKRTN